MNIQDICSLLNINTDDKNTDEIFEAVITSASHNYYSGEGYQLSDRIFDFIYDLYYEVNPTSEVFKTIGAKVKGSSSFLEVAHNTEMLSQNKIHDCSELTSYFKLYNEEFCISEKLDGLAISLLYEVVDEHAYLVKAVTRGDGDIGLDITENARQINDIKRAFCVSHSMFNVPKFEIRGEVYMLNSVFEEVRDEAIKVDNKHYKTPRNLAAGSLKRKDVTITAQRKLNFSAYDCDIEFDTYTAKLVALSDIGISTVNFNKMFLKEIQEHYTNYFEIRTLLDYDIDGLVIRYNNQAVYDTCNITNKKSKGSVALKFNHETDITTVVDIKWSVSRTGLINPVVIFEPIELCGAEIKKASLHNVSRMKKLRIGKKSIIVVSRRNDVIPEVEEVIDNYVDTEVPATCPSCGKETRVFISDTKVETLYCINKNCSSKLISKLTYFCRVVGMKGISVKLIEELVDKNIINNFNDIFELTERTLSTNLNRTGIRRIGNILNSIERAREIQLWKFVSALGIETLGTESSKQICSDYDTFDKLVQSLLDKNVKSTLSDVELELLNEDYLLLAKQFKFITSNSSVGILTGLTFCLSGTLPSGKEKVKNLIEKHGGIVVQTVTKEVSVLVAGENSGNKSERAKQLNIDIITEQDLIDWGVE